MCPQTLQSAPNFPAWSQVCSIPRYQDTGTTFHLQVAKWLCAEDILKGNSFPTTPTERGDVALQSYATAAEDGLLVHELLDMLTYPSQLVQGRGQVPSGWQECCCMGRDLVCTT